MKTQNVSFHGRFLAVLATIIATAALVACGGGGGATTPVVTPPPAPTPVNAAMTATVTPADSATGVARDVKLIVTFTTNAGNFASTTATETCGGVSQALTASMPVTSGKTTTVNWTVATPRLYGATCTYQVLGTATGTDGGAQVNTNTRGTFTVEQLACSKPGEQVSADGQTCAPVATTLHYTDKVYALWTDKYPYAVTRSGVTKVKNTTQWNGLGKDLFLCFIANHPLADGKVLTLCKDLAGLKWHTLYIDPTKDEMYEYLGTVPSDLFYTVASNGGIPAETLGKNWLDWDTATAAHPLWYSFAKVTDGYFYAEVGSSGGLLKFVGNDGAVSTVADKDPLVNGNGTIQVMWSYNN